MEPNFVKASSENLPEVNYVMIQELFAKNMDYFSVEFKSVKNVRLVFLDLEIKLTY